MKIVPDNFKVPEKLETGSFRLRMLSVDDVVKDYDAVMTSIEHLRGVFGEGSTWPKKDLTLEQDLIDLGWHQKEFQMRTSFAYTVMNLEETRCLGCMYIFPSDNPNFEVEIYMWVRQSAFEEGLDPLLEKAVKEWIRNDWLFTKVSYPGRD